MTEDFQTSLVPEDVLALDDRARKALQIGGSVLGKAFIGPGSRKISPKAVLMFGKKLRDETLWEYPILPGATSVWQQLASGREWMMSGKPRAVARGVEWVNNTQIVDVHSGMVLYGYESFLKRRALDYLCLGRTAFAVSDGVFGKGPVLEYIDPTYLTFRRDSKKKGPVRENEKVWQYIDKREFRAREIHLDHPLPIGMNGFIAPIASILPTATLAWLIREHNAASLDGRKIRDILFVANPHLKKAVETAIHQVAALWSGQGVDQVGVPVVELNNPAGVAVKDLFAMMGLSRMPEKFEESEFWFMYVNEISANLSLALRHFWNSERTTNKALEEVQERRGQQKGPATFVRSEQRLMAKPGVLDHLQGGGKRLRMGFIEEVDSSARLDNAKILLQTTQALVQVGKLFGAAISLDGYLAWMQALQVLPNELKLIESAKDMVVVNPDDTQTGDPDDKTEESDPAPIALDEAKMTLVQRMKSVLDSPAYYLDYDEVTVSGVTGQVIDRRVKMVTVAKLITAEKLAAEVQADTIHTPEEALQKGIEAMNQANRVLFKIAYPTIQTEVDDWIKKQHLFKKDVVKTSIQTCLNDETLTDQQQSVIDEIVGRFIDEPVGEIE